MQCVILAGGEGTRMRPLTNDLPKALIPVSGTPFVHYQLDWLAREGVREVVLSIGYRGDLIREYVGDGSRWGVSVTYVDEGVGLRGTAGALRLALDVGALEESFFLLYGDSYLTVRLQPIWDAFSRSGMPVLMAVYRNEDRWDSSNVVFDDGRVTLYRKGPAARTVHMAYIDYGLSVLARTVIERRVPRRARADMADVFHELSLAGELAGYEVRERFYEVGSPAGLRELEDHLAAGRR